MAIVELNDVQADVAAPYPGAAAVHLFFRFPRQGNEIDGYRSFAGPITELANLVTRADTVSATTAVTTVVGVTGAFLEGVRLSDVTRSTLSPAFLDGMRARAELLSDRLSDWRAPLADTPVDLVVIVRYRDEEAGTLRVADVRALLEAAGASCVLEQHAHGLLADRVRAAPGDANAAFEHFGFRDGISNPILEGTPQRLTPGNGVLVTQKSGRRGKVAPLEQPIWRRIKPGEFLLGYEDEMGELNLLPQNARLLRNATYLVWRKLEQDVEGFDRTVAQGGDGFGERLVGRRTSGEPLAEGNAINDFTFAGSSDPGSGCPVTAHIRRMNPRAGIDLADQVVHRHRLVRRSMPYTDEDGSRGLLFLSYQASIERQFEFVQRQWLATGELLRIGAASDALTGQRPDEHPGLPQFVTCRGGEYFLVLGLLGLAELARQIGAP
jgi:Dyp-type peroxidase family